MQSSLFQAFVISKTLKYMPEGLIVRVPGARWVLPSKLLPGIPEDTPLHKRRGLYLIRPSPIAFRIKYEKVKCTVRRTQFSAVPANAMIVYGAQGESYDTAIADLGMPPSQDPHIFWLAVYVMLTRCKSLDGLLLLRLPSRNSLTLGPPSYVLEEMQRLDALHASTMARLHKNLRNDVGDLPPKVEALFTSADVDAGAPDWEALGALIDAELAARKKASGMEGRRRVNEKNCPAQCIC